MITEFSIEEQMQFTENHIQEGDSHSVLNSLEIQQERLSTCMSCQYITEDRHCAECECPIVMMSQFNFKTCPKGYWK